jgi:hypothetical protein
MPNLKAWELPAFPPGEYFLNTTWEDGGQANEKLLLR